MTNEDYHFAGTKVWKIINTAYNCFIPLSHSSGNPLEKSIVPEGQLRSLGLGCKKKSKLKFDLKNLQSLCA